MGQFNVLACLVLLLHIFLAQAIAAASRSEASDPYPLNNVNGSVYGAPTREAKPPISSKASAAEGEDDKEESSSRSGAHEGAAAPEIRRLGKNHSSSDKSVAGGGVIIGGLVTVAFAAVYCYIRVTRQTDGSLDHPHQTAKL